MKPKCVTIQMKAIEQYFHVVLCIMLYKVVLTCKSTDETLVCDYSNENYRLVLPYGMFIMLYKVVLTFKSADETLVCDHYRLVFSCGID